LIRTCSSYAIFIIKGAELGKILKKNAEEDYVLKIKYGINTAKGKPGIVLDSKTIIIPK